jgi:hypothetical protein
MVLSVLAGAQSGNYSLVMMAGRLQGKKEQIFRCGFCINIATQAYAAR